MSRSIKVRNNANKSKTRNDQSTGEVAGIDVIYEKGGKKKDEGKARLKVIRNKHYNPFTHEGRAS